ncbi:hypothetical protein CHS0354_037198 [Potamilus streckersoni]|uniref:Uncharacterized protein n=1 Tax=Potamilus streckersoni TaxID=2493646 RepID=A0AAE0SX65_9BIVA|nr:hypothetical protein CHS0354_037198 [Potamilus streckersoni]
MSDLEGTRKVVFLLDLLKRISPSEQTDLRSEIRTGHVSKETDNRPYFQYNLGKRDFMILPPANEWCRLMGFRKCPYYGS